MSRPMWLLERPLAWLLDQWPWDVWGYQMQYMIWQGMAALFWKLNQVMLFMALMVYTLKKSLIDITGANGGGIVISLLNGLLTRTAGTPGAALWALITTSALIAALIFFISLTLRPLMRLEIVNLKRAMSWLAASAILFSLGANFFLTVEQWRDDLRSLAASTVFSSGSVGQAVSTSNAGYTSIPRNQPSQMGELRHWFSDVIPTCPEPNCPNSGPQNGLDLAMGFVFGHDPKELTLIGGGGNPSHMDMPERFVALSADNQPAPCRTPPCVGPPPADGYAGYFYWRPGIDTNITTNDDMQQAVDRGTQGAVRMMAMIPVSLFALVESLINLALTIAATILFFSVPVAMIFAFFSSTETIAMGIVKSYMNLFVKTYALTAMLALLYFFLLYWALQGNWGAYNAVSVIMLLVVWQFVGIAWGTVQSSLSVVTSSLSQVLGTNAGATVQARQAATKVGSMGLRAGSMALGLATGGTSLLATKALSAAGAGLGALGSAGRGVGSATGLGESMDGVKSRVRQAASGLGQGVRERMVYTQRDDGAEHSVATDKGLFGSRFAQEGASWRDEDHARTARQGILSAVGQTGDPKAQAHSLAALRLPKVAEAQVGALVRTNPDRVRHIMSALNGLAKSGEAHDMVFSRNGQLDTRSNGMQALNSQLRSLPLSTDDMADLMDTPQGQSDLSLLVGSTLGLQHKFDDTALLSALTSGAQSDRGIAETADSLGIHERSFGRNYAPVKRLIEDAHRVGLTDVTDLVRLARRMHDLEPGNSLNYEQRHKFARASGGSQGLRALNQLERAVGDQAARDNVQEPDYVEKTIKRMLVDSMQVPKSLTAGSVPGALPPSLPQAIVSVLDPTDYRGIDTQPTQPQPGPANAPTGRLQPLTPSLTQPQPGPANAPTGRLQPIDVREVPTTSSRPPRSSRRSGRTPVRTLSPDAVARLNPLPTSAANDSEDGWNPVVVPAPSPSGPIPLGGVGSRPSSRQQRRTTKTPSGPVAFTGVESEANPRWVDSTDELPPPVLATPIETPPISTALPTLAGSETLAGGDHPNVGEDALDEPRKSEQGSPPAPRLPDRSPLALGANSTTPKLIEGVESPSEPQGGTPLNIVSPQTVVEQSLLTDSSPLGDQIPKGDPKIAVPIDKDHPWLLG